MDKSNHRVTVDREYLEMLEKAFEENKNNEFNMRGEVRNINVNQLSFGQLKPFTSYKALFIKEDLREVSTVICTDEEGREICKFIKHELSF